MAAFARVRSGLRHARERKMIFAFTNSKGGVRSAADVPDRLPDRQTTWAAAPPLPELLFQLDEGAYCWCGREDSARPVPRRPDASLTVMFCWRFRWMGVPEYQLVPANPTGSVSFSLAVEFVRRDRRQTVLSFRPGNRSCTPNANKLRHEMIGLSIITDGFDA